MHECHVWTYCLDVFSCTRFANFKRKVNEKYQKKYFIVHCVKLKSINLSKHKHLTQRQAFHAHVLANSQSGKIVKSGKNIAFANFSSCHMACKNFCKSWLQWWHCACCQHAMCYTFLVFSFLVCNISSSKIVNIDSQNKSSILLKF